MAKHAHTTRRALFAAAPAFALIPAFAALSATPGEDWGPLESFLAFAHPDGATVSRYIRAAAKHDWAGWERAYDTRLLRAAMRPSMVRGIVFSAFSSGDGLQVLFSTPTTGSRHPNVVVDKNGARPRCGGLWFA